MKIAIYPGSFDPVTLGHLDIIERASELFDKLIVVVMHNVSKFPIFTAEERMHLLRCVTDHLPNVEIDGYSGLLADYAGKRGACTIVKGLRAMSDFENEFSMALANRKLNPDVDTAFLMTSAEYMYLSSSMVKDIALHGGSIAGFVPPKIEKEILHRVRKDG
ncbi:MAG: pantetheine-phosphate adenylyltransferase [Butyricicoccus pullicaecorum]|nr:pantetheine-phosphate adenylyltransferase [Butyricicoccus pullicaecorum]